MTGAILAVLLLVPILFDVFWGGRNSSYIEKLKASGEPMTIEQARPPAVPAEENSAAAFLRAAALVEADTSLLRTNRCDVMEMAGPGKAVVCSQAPVVAGWESTNSWAEVKRALAGNRTALTLLHELAEHPALDFKVSYEPVMGYGWDLSSMKFSEAKKSAEYLSSAILSDLHDGDASEAITNERALIALGKAMQYQGVMISDLVGMNFLAIAEASSWEILQSTNVTEAQLAVLEREWERVDYIRNWANALPMERLAAERTVAYKRRTTTAPGAYLGIGKSAAEIMGIGDSSDSPLDTAKKNGNVFLWRVWWSYPDELRALQGYEVLLNASRFVATNECFETAISNQTAGLAAVGITNLPMPFLFFGGGDLQSWMTESVQSALNILDKVMAAETGREMTIAAIALQRFRLTSGHFPAQLSELVPKYESAVPPDPVDGKPLHYRLQSDGTFLLYSVGENGVDDGGNPDAADHSTNSYYWLRPGALDWVWPQAVRMTDR